MPLYKNEPMTLSFINDLQIPRAQVRYLDRNYNTLEYAQVLRSMLMTVFNEIYFSDYSKAMLHRQFNDSLITYYNGEISLNINYFVVRLVEN